VLQRVSHQAQSQKSGTNSLIVGSAAAAVQATIPNVVASSWFAVSQSAAAGGAGVGIVTAITQAGGTAVAGAGGVLAWLKK
jgi:hypothetical protein